METKNVLIRAMSETREVYEAPAILSVEVEVEQGFQMSSLPGPGNANGDPDGDGTY